jgi:hypothetical protein
LDEQWRETFKVAKERTSIGMGEILFHVIAKVEGNRIHMIIWIRKRKDVERRIAIPRITAHRQIYSSSKFSELVKGGV